jgi:glycosyltransferase 2 family protein
MKKVVLNSFKYIFFFGIGVLIFWLIYRNVDTQELGKAVRDINYFWVCVSIIFGMLANLSRAIRWKMLMKPLGYKPRLSNTFMSIFVMYFVNLIIPRAGEIARCTVLSRTDKIPFTKLVGTVFVERLADFFMLLFLSIVIFAMNIPVITGFFTTHPEMLEKIDILISYKNLFLLILLLIVLLICFILIRKRIRKSKHKSKIAEIKEHLVDGIKSIMHLENKWLFIGHTFFIFCMWLMMMYVIFLSYAPTKDLTIRDGMVTFLMGGLAMLAPIQGGIGPWHFMVYETLTLYGIPIDQGKIFALICHTASNLLPYIIFGGISLIILVYRTGKIKKYEIEEIEETPLA